MHRLTTRLTITLTLLTVGAGAAQDAPGRAPPRITLPRGATLPEAIESLRRATQSTILAEIPTVPRTLQTALTNAPLPEALDTISHEFEVYWQQRGKTLVLLRRYRDERERPDVVADEMREITAEALRLVTSQYSVEDAEVGSEPLRLQQGAFVAQLTPDQIRMMREGGLPFARLPAEQQERWVWLNRERGYNEVRTRVRHLSEAFRNWRQAALEYQTRSVRAPGPGGQLSSKTALCLAFPNAYSPARNKQGALQILPHVGPRSGRPQTRRGWGSALSATVRALTATVKKPFRLAAGETTVAQIVAAIESTSGIRVSVPEYGGPRRLYASAAGDPGGEVLGALESLYGWQFRFSARNRYVLGRPRLEASDAFEFHQAIRATIPPALQLLVSEEAWLFGRSGRYRDNRASILGEVARQHGTDWKRAPTTTMSEDVQRRLAALLAEEHLPPIMRPFEDLNAPLWLATPQAGHFTLDGEPAPNKHPLLGFHVRRPDGKIDMWGWFLNSGSP